jgi:hypothetical protein
MIVGDGNTRGRGLNKPKGIKGGIEKSIVALPLLETTSRSRRLD